MGHIYVSFFIFWYVFCQITCLENGLARTPPMGWLAWERFKCNTRCDINPSTCISENLFIEMADRLVSDGYKDAGYEYVNIDDCWMAPTRDVDGNMLADPERFPRGIKFLSDYMHSKGLKLGIYQDFGERTCMGFPGIIGHMEQDVKKFDEWDVDMLKLDGCHSRLNELDDGYIKMGKYLKKLKKPILYSCSWPYYQLLSQIEPNYKLISSHCNMWRNYHDIQDSWKSIEGIIQFFGDNQEVLSPYIGPGQWSDPDMLMIGNPHLSLGQSRAQMGIWAMIPAPLLMSNDLRAMKPGTKEILQNKKVISINQDYLGIPGKRIYKKNKIEIWRRNVLPLAMGETSYALLFLNRQRTRKASLKFTLFELGLESSSGYSLTDLFLNKIIGIYQVNDTLKISVLPMDVTMLHLVIT